jgi:transposase
MRKTHEVLRLHFDLKLKQRQIARSANLSQSTVHEYLHRFTAAGLSWPLPEQMSEPELEAALFPTDPKPARAPARDLPDFAVYTRFVRRNTVKEFASGAPVNVHYSGMPVTGERRGF